MTGCRRSAEHSPETAPVSSPGAQYLAKGRARLGTALSGRTRHHPGPEGTAAAGKAASRTRRGLTIAELASDPEGKLRADASLTGERVKDMEGLESIWKRIRDIDAIIEETGGSDVLEKEKDDLLAQVNGFAGRERLESSVEKAYENVTKQLRNLRSKLNSTMPKLAAHLESCIVPDGKTYSIQYIPPSGTPSWIILI